MTTTVYDFAWRIVLSAPRSTFTDPVPVTEGTLNEYACGLPMRGRG